MVKDWTLSPYNGKKGKDIALAASIHRWLVILASTIRQEKEI